MRHIASVLHVIATSPVIMSHRRRCFMQSFLVWTVSRAQSFAHGIDWTVFCAQVVGWSGVVRGDARRALAPLNLKKVFMLPMWSAVSAQSHGCCLDLPSNLPDIRWPNPALCRPHDFAGQPRSLSPLRPQEASYVYFCL